MKELFSSLVIIILFVLASTSIVFADHHENGINAAVEINEAEEETSNTTRNIVAGTGLCVGGAIVGSIVPIVGTAIGCGIGVAWAWFIRKPG